MKDQLVVEEKVMGSADYDKLCEKIGQEDKLSAKEQEESCVITVSGLPPEPFIGHFVPVR